MRTSSATAGNTDTEYKLLSMTAGMSGLNLANQKYLLTGGNSVTNAVSTTKALSGEPSVNQSIIGYTNKLATQKQKPHTVKAKKFAKRNLATTSGSNGAPMFNLPQ